MSHLTAMEDTNLTDSASLLSENLLSVCSADDDVGDGGGDADFDAGVALLGQLTLEELVELGVEDTVCYELAALGDVDTTRGGCWGCHAGLWLGVVFWDPSKCVVLIG